MSAKPRQTEEADAGAAAEAAEAEAEAADEAVPDEPHALEQGLDVYPLRAAADDPRWALRTMVTWIAISVFLLVFIVALLVAGVFYD